MLCVSCDKADDEKETVFVHDRSVYQFAENAQYKKLFDVSSGVRNRAVEKINGRYLYWDKKDNLLKLCNSQGKVLSSSYLKAGVVWIDGNRILANDYVYIEEKGFCYIAYDVTIHNDKIALKEIWKTYLDCFNSDVLFLDEGKILLAGNKRSKVENELYIIDTTEFSSKPVLVYSYPKADDFARIIKSDDKIIVFNSHRDKTRAPFVIYQFDLNDILSRGYVIPKRFNLKFRETISVNCFYGYGFAFEGDVVIPCAQSSDDKSDIVFARFTFNEGSWELKNVSENCGGCICVFDYDDVHREQKYFVHDVKKSSSIYGIACYNGEKCNITYIK